VRRAIFVVDRRAPKRRGPARCLPFTTSILTHADEGD
jgi:hypothetical protein